MKKVYFPLILLMIFGCTDEREKVIGDYVQTIGNVKTDMSFSVRKLKELEPITAKDSIDILTKDYARQKDEFIITFNRQITVNKSQLEVLEYNIQNYQTNFPGKLSKSELQDRLDDFNKHKEETKSRIDDLTDQVEKVQNDQINQIANFDDRAGKELVGLKLINDRINSYEANPGLALANRCRVTYKIKNPLMNKAKQEITKVFIFSPDNKKILGEIME